MYLYCIADEDTVRGFKLAGVSGLTVSTALEAASALQTAIGQSDCAIIILTETVADGIRAQVNQVREKSSRPLIVEIPGPRGSLSGRKSLRQLAQEAVGIHFEQQGT